MNIQRLVWIIASAIFILVVNVILSILYMVFYAYLINPGHDEQFYQEYVKTSAPICSIVFGIPLFYVVCRWLVGKWEKDFALKSAISVWIVYALIDVTILLIAGLTLQIVFLMTISLVTKLIAAYFGGINAGKRLT